MINPTLQTSVFQYTIIRAILYEGDSTIENVCKRLYVKEEDKQSVVREMAWLQRSGIIAESAQTKDNFYVTDDGRQTVNDIRAALGLNQI